MFETCLGRFTSQVLPPASIASPWNGERYACVGMSVKYSSPLIINANPNPDPNPYRLGKSTSHLFSLHRPRTCQRGTRAPLFPAESPTMRANALRAESTLRSKASALFRDAVSRAIRHREAFPIIHSASLLPCHERLSRVLRDSRWA